MGEHTTRSMRSRRRGAMAIVGVCCASVFAVLGLSSIGAEEPPIYPDTFTIGATGAVDALVIASAQNSLGMTFNNAAAALAEADPLSTVAIPLDHLGDKSMTLDETSVTVDASRAVITLRGTSSDTSTLLAGVDAEVLVIFAWSALDADRNPEVSTSFKATPTGGLGAILGEAGIIEGLDVGPVVVTIGDGAAYSSLNDEAKPAHLSRTANLTDDAVLFFEGVYFPEGRYDLDNVPDDRKIEGLPDPVPQLAAGSDQTMLATSLGMGPLGDLARAALGVDASARVALGGGLGFHLFGEPDGDGKRPGLGDFDPKVTEWSLNATLPSAGLPVGLDGIFRTDTSLQWQLGLRYQAGSGGTGSGSYSFTAQAALTTDLISDRDDKIVTTIKLTRSGPGAYAAEVTATIKDWQPFGIDWLPEIAEVRLSGGVSRSPGTNGTPGPITFSGEFRGTVKLFDEADVQLLIGGSFARGAFDARVSATLNGTVNIGEIGDLLTGGAFDLAEQAPLDALEFSNLVVEARVGRSLADGGTTTTTTTTAPGTTTTTSPGTTTTSSTTTSSSTTTTSSTSTTTTTTSPGTTTTTTVPPRPKYTYTFRVSAAGTVDVTINGTTLGASGLLIVDQSGITVGARPELLDLQTLLGPTVEVPAGLNFALSDPANGSSFGVLFSTTPRKIDPTTLGSYPIAVRDFFRPMFGVATGSTTTFEYQIPGGIAAVGTFGLPEGLAGVVEAIGVQSRVRLEGSVPLFGQLGFELRAALQFAPTKAVCTEPSPDDRSSPDLLLDDGDDDGIEETLNPEALTTTATQLECEDGARIDFIDSIDLDLALTGDLNATALGARFEGSITLALPAGLPPEAASRLRLGGIDVPDWTDVDVPGWDGVKPYPDVCAHPTQVVRPFVGQADRLRCYDLVRLGVGAAIDATPEKVSVDLSAFADTKPGGFLYPFGVDWVGFGDFRVELGVSYSYGSAGSVGVRLGFAGNAQLNLPLPGGDTFTKDVFVAASARLQSTTTFPPVVTIFPEGFAFSTETGLGLSDIAQFYNSFQSTLTGTTGQQIPDLGSAYPDLNLRNLTFALGIQPGGVPSLCIPFGLEITADLYWGTEFTPRGMNCDTSASVPGADSSHCLDDQRGGCLASLSLKIGTTGIFGDISVALDRFVVGIPGVSDVLTLDDLRFAIGLSPATQFVRFQAGAEIKIPNGPEILDAEIDATIKATSVEFLGTASIVNSSVRGLVSGFASANPFQDPLSLRFDVILAADVDGYFGGSRLQEELLTPVAETVRIPLRLASVLAQINDDYARNGSIRDLIKRLPNAFEQAGLDVPREIRILNDSFVRFLDLIEPIEKFVNQTVDKLLNGISLKSVVPKELRSLFPDSLLNQRIPGICQIFFTDEIFHDFRKIKDGQITDECDRKKIIPGVVVPLIERQIDELLGFDVDVQALLDRLAAPPEQGGLDLTTLPFDDLCLVIDVDFSPLPPGVLDASFGAQASAKLYGQPIGVSFEFDLSDYGLPREPKAVLEMARRILQSFALDTDPADFSELCEVSPELREAAEPVPPVPAGLTSASLSPAAIDEGGEVLLEIGYDRALLEPHTVRIDWGDDGTGEPAVETIELPAAELEDGQDPADLPPATFTFRHTYVDDNPTGTPFDRIFVRVADLTGVADGALPVELLADGRVDNLDPTIELTRIGSTGPIVEGELIEFELTVDDPGTRDDLTVLIEWGDGDEDELFFAADDADRTVTVAHRWADERPSGTPSDVLDVFARVTDDDTGVAETSLEVTVVNKDPWDIEISGATLVERVDGTVTPRGVPGDSVVEGELYEFEFSYIDVLDDAHTMVIDWGDDTTTELPDGDTPLLEIEEPDGTVVFLPDVGNDDDTDFALLDADGDPVTVVPIEVPELFDAAGNPVRLVSYDTEIALFDAAGEPAELPPFVGTGIALFDAAGNPFELWPTAGSGIELFDADGIPVELLPPDELSAEPVFARRTVTVTHRWLDDDPTKDPVDLYDITVDVVDDDTGSAREVRSFEVLNRAPWDLSISEPVRIASFAEEPLGPVTRIVEGDRYEFELTFTDLTADSHVLEVTWDDGTTTLIEDVDSFPTTTLEPYPNGVATVRTVTLTHRWDDDDPEGTSEDLHVIGLRVLDDDQQQSTLEREVVVADVAPEIVRQGWYAPGESRGRRFDLPAPVIDEYDFAVIDVELADPSRGDSHIVTVDWGDGTEDDVIVFDPVSFDDDPIDTPTFTDNYVARPFQVRHQYGDNGVFVVTFTVVDDDGLSTTTTTEVTVLNVDPTLTLDRSETVPAWPGPTFTTQIGIENEFNATSYDPGSDDLTFTWRFGDGTEDVETYFRGDGPDPFPSPEVDPQTITDRTSHTYVRACLYELTVDVVDDDGGEGPTERAPVVVVGLETKSRPTGWWGSRYGPLLPDKPRPFSTDEFDCYLQIAEHMSSVMGEVRDISTFDAAAAVLHGGDMPTHDARARLEGEILAAWLNYASGAVGVTPTGKIDLGYMESVYAIEAIARDPAATAQALQRAHVELQRLQRVYD